MRALRSRLAPALALGALLALAAACEEAPPPANTRLRMQVGIHDVALELVPGWAHFDHGSEQRFHKGLAQISRADTGPATPGAYRHEVVRALGLFRKGQREDARDALKRLDLQREFADVREWREFRALWNVAQSSGLRRKYDDIDVENAYLEVLRVVDAFEERDLDALVERALPEVDTAVHRAVAESRELEISGHEARLLETWDKLSHDHVRSYLFALVRGHLLVVRMELGELAELQPAFDVIVATLEIDPDERPVRE